MERLLKIVEGPMRGAEIALVAGTRIKVGRGEDCDIVIDDASLPETAFELDIADAAVTLIAADGTAREMRPFEIHDFGTTSVALGPAEGRWEELRPAEREAPVESTPSEQPPSAETPTPAAPSEEEKPADEKRRNGLGCFFVCLGVILLVLIVLALLWLFRHAVVERFPQVKPYVDQIERRVGGSSAVQTPAVPKKTSKEELKDLAAQHGVSYSEREGVPVLAGNLAHRTERLAMRALALAADRHCILELSDDETLASSADALLFTVTEGALKLKSAAKRKAVIVGYAPTAAALGAALKALRDDVPWIGEIDVESVKVGGPVPSDQRHSAFAVSGTLAGGSSEAADGEGSSGAAGQAQSSGGPTAAPDIVISDENGRKLPRNMFPVAGILTRPYPCVVLRDGHRIVEGGQLGAYTVVRIAADALELKLGKGKANWNP